MTYRNNKSQQLSANDAMGGFGSLEQVLDAYLQPRIHPWKKKHFLAAARASDQVASTTSEVGMLLTNKKKGGPTVQRGCGGLERGSIVRSRFFFGSFLFINGKEMNDQVTGSIEV